jgi:hypothetical protein
MSDDQSIRPNNGEMVPVLSGSADTWRALNVSWASKDVRSKDGNGSHLYALRRAALLDTLLQWPRIEHGFNRLSHVNI